MAGKHYLSLLIPSFHYGCRYGFVYPCMACAEDPRVFLQLPLLFTKITSLLFQILFPLFTYHYDFVQAALNTHAFFLASNSQAAITTDNHLTPILSHSSSSTDSSHRHHTARTPSTSSTSSSYLSPSSVGGRSRSSSRSSNLLEVPRPKLRHRSSSASLTSASSIRETIDGLSGFRRALRHIG